MAPEPDQWPERHSGPPTFSQAQELQHALQGQGAEVGRQTRPELRFVRLQHTPEYGTQIADAVSDCDELAIEHVIRGPESLRKEFERDYNQYLSGSAERRAELDERLSRRNPTMQKLLARLVETNSRVSKIHLIDISSEHKAATEAGIRAKLAYRAYFQERRQFATTPNKKLLELRLQSLQAQSKYDRLRDEVVDEQLRTLVAQTPSDKRIGILRGATHPAEDPFDKEAPVETISVGAGASSEPQYSYSDQAVIQAKNHPSHQIDPQLLNRVLLHDLYVASGVLEPRDREPTEADYDQAIDTAQQQVIDHMTDEEVTNLLARLDSLKGSEDSRRKIETELYANALFYNPDQS